MMPMEYRSKNGMYPIEKQNFVWSRKKTVKCENLVFIVTWTMKKINQIKWGEHD